MRDEKGNEGRVKIPYNDNLQQRALTPNNDGKTVQAGSFSVDKYMKSKLVLYDLRKCVFMIRV